MRPEVTHVHQHFTHSHSLSARLPGLDPTLLYSLESLPARSRAWRVIQRFLSLQDTPTDHGGANRSRSGPNPAATKYITAGLSQQSLVRVSAWLHRFYMFLAFNNDLSSPPTWYYLKSRITTSPSTSSHTWQMRTQVARESRPPPEQSISSAG